MAGMRPAGPGRARLAGARRRQGAGVIRPDPFRHAAQSGDRLSLSDLLDLHGEASPAVLLLVLSVLCVLPVYGVGTALSFAILAMAWRWGALTRGGTGLGTGLSDRLGQLSLNETWSRRCLHGLAWMYATAGRCLRTRWTALCHPRTGPWWGLWIALMGLVIFLPLPFGNVLPSISLVLLSLGWTSWLVRWPPDSNCSVSGPQTQPGANGQEGFPHQVPEGPGEGQGPRAHHRRGQQGQSVTEHPALAQEHQADAGQYIAEGQRQKDHQPHQG